MTLAEIRTQRLIIREFMLEDAAALAIITADPYVVRYLSFAPATPSEARALVDFALASAAKEPRMDYVLAVTRDGTLVGSCGLSLQPGDLTSAEAYFVLRSSEWGRGLGTELLTALLGYGLDMLGLRRIFGVAHPENVASVRVMEKAGMTYEGPEQQAFGQEGRWQDGERYAIIRERNL